MRRGPVTFFSTRTPDEAWPTVLQLLQEEGWVFRKVAHRLGVHHRTLYKWLKSTGYDKHAERHAAEAMKEKIEHG
jgi:transposase